MQLPTLAEIETTRRLIDPFVVETPVWRWQNRHLTDLLGHTTEVWLKLELFQHTGTFKPRGAIRVMLELDDTARARGVTAVSAGNHAIAVGYAAQQLDSTAKVVMPKTANPARVALCRAYGAEVVLVDNVHQAFERVRQIEAEEGRSYVHPFEGPLTALGTATVGLELCRQVAGLDAVIVPIGGGGLCAGIAAAVKLLQPRCQVIGVEPEGADTMHRSFASGRPEAIDKVRSIADSLGAPFAEPYSFGLCQRFVDELVRVSDDELRRAMGLIYQGVKLAVEPAGAAATAALVGPLREKLAGRRVGLIVCGSNIDPATFAAQVSLAGPEGA
ncbi:MAG: Phenylserine dehydratase [Anaerolineae bacterium]|nr:Phenylserine dehydratase [Anaerolineae bacterium]